MNHDRYHNNDPQSYAALWGSTVGDGPLFYNVSSAPVGQLGWNAAQWQKFVAACVRLIDTVEKNPKSYGPHDAADLRKLLGWAKARMRETGRTERKRKA